MKKNILIVDDHPDYYEILRDSEINYNFILVSSLFEMNKVVQEQTINLILLDWDLTNEHGIDCLPDIKNNYLTSKIPIIMLTGRSFIEDLVFALNLGADDYISKPADLSVLLAKISANLRKYHYNNVSQNTFTQGLHFNENDLSVEVHNKKIILRKKEFEILKTLSTNPDKVFTRDELNAITTGQKICVSPRTIDTFITHLRNKLKGFELIQTIPRKGYKFNEDFLKKIKMNKNINDFTMPSTKGDLI